MGDAKVCLDLFAGLGGFSAAFDDADGWEVYTVEIDDSHEPDLCEDIYDLRPTDLPDPDIILASPPCQKFSIVNQGNGDWENGSPKIEGCKDAIGLVYHTLGIIHGLDPDYWFMENPRGLLRTVIGNPEGTVTYCQYGTPYQKPTDLWGNHPPGFSYLSCSPGSDCHIANPRDEHPTQDKYPDDVSERSKVPYELSEAIREAVDAAERGDVREQATLPYAP